MARAFWPHPYLDRSAREQAIQNKVDMSGHETLHRDGVERLERHVKLPAHPGL